MSSSSERDNVEPLPRRALVAGAPIRPIVPTTIEEAFRLAQWICGAHLAPDSYGLDEDTVLGGKDNCIHKFTNRTCTQCGAKVASKGDPDPQKVVIGILKSIEVGLPPITGLSTIAIVRKRPVIWGDGAMALVQQQGLIEKVEQFYEGDENLGSKDFLSTDFPDTFAAVFRIWRKGHANPYEGRFSVRDAKRAHLWSDPKKKPWQEYPKRMLMARARAYPLREGFADALSGLSIREEIEDLPSEPPPRTNTDFLEDAPAGQRALSAPAEEPPDGSISESADGPPSSAERPEGESQSSPSGDAAGTPSPPSGRI